jgi:hypothetical protein
MITQQTHVIALVTPQLLNPFNPTESPLFEKAAQLQKTFDCKVTLPHITPPHSMGRSIEETLAFKVLTRRVNLRFRSDFRTHTETAELSLKSVDALIKQLRGDLLLRETTGEYKLDSTSISLLESATYPVWYICSNSEITEIRARIFDTEDSRTDDMLTCTVAQDLGQVLGSDVELLHSPPNELNAGDLVVACVPTPQARNDEQLIRLRREAVNMLKSPISHDLLVHRGAEITQLPAVV